VLVGAIHDRTRYRRTPTELYGADAYLERPQLPDALWPILREFGIPLAGVAPTPEPRQELPYPMSAPAFESAMPHAPEPPPVPEPVAHSAPPPEPFEPPVTPVTPSEPVAPIAPAAPIEPVAPVAPVEPVEPVAPVAPVEQIAPVAPVETIAPIAPVEPIAPLAPVAPIEAPAPPQSVVAPGSEAVSEAEIAKAERLARIVVSDIILYNQEKFESALSSGDIVTTMDSELEEGRTLFAQRIDARVRDLRDFLGEELMRVAGLRRSQ